MLRVISLDKNVFPFSLSSEFSLFQEKYILSKKNKDPHAITFVFQQLAPTFSKWDFMMKNDDFYSDITIYTLLRLLQADDRTPKTIENKLALLKRYLNFFTLSFYDICVEAFFLHINKKAYIPMYKYSKPKDLFYYIAKEIKMFIFSIVRKMINYQNRQEKIDFSSFSLKESYYDSYFDANVISTFSEVEYSHYLYLLIMGKFPNKNDINYTENFIKDDLICQLTKMLLSSN
jgi:hypothetical protein